MRLVKYCFWGFEIFWSGLEQLCVDLYIYYEPELINQFNGLARLLALEWLFDVALYKANLWLYLE